MSFKQLKNTENKKYTIAAIGVIALIVITLGFAMFQSPFDVAIEVNVQTASGSPISSGQTIMETDGLKVEVIDMIDRPVCNLYTVYEGEERIVSTGIATESGQGYDVTYSFDLSGVYEGTHEYFLRTVEELPWRSFNFFITSEGTSPDPDLQGPIIVDAQQDITVDMNSVTDLTWGVQFAGKATIEFYKGGSLIKTLTHNEATNNTVTYTQSYQAPLYVTNTIFSIKVIPDSGYLTQASASAQVNVIRGDYMLPTIPPVEGGDASLAVGIIIAIIIFVMLGGATYLIMDTRNKMRKGK